MSDNTEHKIPFLTCTIIFITIVTIIAAILTVNFFAAREKQRFSENSSQIAKTFALQSAGILNQLGDDKEALPVLSASAKSLLHSDSGILYVSYLDSKGDVIFTENKENLNISAENYITLSSPLNVYENASLKTIGSVKMGVSSLSNDRLIKKHALSVAFLFFIIWFVFILSTAIYVFIMNRELNILSSALREISAGHFGVKINANNTGRQTRELIKTFNDLSTKLKNYEQQNVSRLILERNKLEAVLMGILNGVIVCDCDDNVVLLNDSAEKILSLTSDTMLNLPIQDYADSNGIHCFREKTEEFKDIPLEIILKTPPEFTININDSVIKCVMSPMFMQNDDYVGYIIVLTDVTKETEVNNMKNRFISNVSHELRTPVTVLRTYIDTLYTMEDELDDATRKEFTATANKEVIRLHRMVNDILDVSRLESPDVELEKESADFSALIRDAVESIQVLADEKNVITEFVQKNDIPLLNINIPSMERVMNNLLSNAVKYSPENGKISVVLKKDDEYVDLSVTDEGCGIEEKHLPKLFDRFYRAENSVHSVKGTGLGLYLVKTAVEKHHGGMVYVTSKVGSGSTFGIKLPLS